jgi:O-antigen ligase
MFLFPVFQERLFLTFKVGGDSDRFRYWLAALKMIKDHPFFGIGVGTFMANFSKYLPNCNISYAHNCYLQIWAETGVLALISFILFSTSLIYFGFKKFLVSKDFLLLGLLSGAVGFLVHSFFEVNLYSLRLAVLFWVWVGLISAIIFQDKEVA